VKTNKKFNVYEEAATSFRIHINQTKVWMLKVFLPVAITAFITSSLSFTSLVQMVLAMGMAFPFVIFISWYVAYPSLSARAVIYRKIVPDAGLMRIAQSRVIPNDIKREVAKIIEKTGEILFSDLIEIDDRLQAQWKEKQYSQDEQQRRRGAGAMALQAVLNTRG
jgi:hypothetical protein